MPSRAGQGAAAPAAIQPFRASRKASLRAVKYSQSVIKVVDFGGNLTPVPDRAIEELKAFEKKDVHLKARAATNLSFIYFLEGDINNANQCAELAVRNSRYNAKALVNKGNCLLVKVDV